MCNRKNKRRWWMVLNEIIVAEGEPDVAKWEELSSLQKGFQQLADSCHWAGYYGAETWKRKFLETMIAEADNISHWRTIAKESEADSPEWNNAIDKVYEMTKGCKIYHRWQQLQWLLPKDHALMTKVRAVMSKIRKEKVAAKLAAKQSF